jgi:hypothetical protein
MNNRSWLNHQYNRFQDAANCTSLSCLRNLSLYDIRVATNVSYDDAWDDGDFGDGHFYWGPVVDGINIRDYPRREFERGNFAQVPVLTDRDGYEGLTFTETDIESHDDLITQLKHFWQGVSDTFLNRTLAVYPTSLYNASYLESLPVVQRRLNSSGTLDHLTDWYAQMLGILSDTVVDCPTHHIAESVSQVGLPAYKMVFNNGAQTHGATSAYLYSHNLNSKSLLRSFSSKPRRYSHISNRLT